jgi:DNA-binding MarR family transcriptional regulator
MIGQRKECEAAMVQESTPEYIAPLLARACKLKHQRMHQLLEGLGLYQGQPAVLRVLWEQDGLTQSELAESLDRSPSTITNMVKRMEKAGFVQRRPDPRDERISRVYLTGAGDSIKAAVRDVWRAFEEQAFAGFSEGELAVLRGFLLRLCQNIEGES